MLKFKISDEIHPEKIPAINHGKGPLMIIAGPGSGKTKVLVWRVAKLLSEEGNTPEQIWLTTFTEKAAQKLKYEIADLVKKFDEDKEISGMLVGTIHSTCLELIREYRDYFPNVKYPPKVLDETKQLLYLSSRYKSLRLDDVCCTARKKPPLEKIVDVMLHLNWLSDHEVDPDDYLEKMKKLLTKKSDVIKEEDYWMARTYKKYLDLIEKDGFLDFPGILREVAYAIEHKGFASKVAERIKYILVDEYQDVNPLQEYILNAIAKASGESNITVVGDDDQAIYQFRGAGVGTIRSFEAKFKPVNVNLRVNFRSPDHVVQATSELISTNPSKSRFSKELKSWEKRKKENLHLLKVHEDSLNKSANKLAKTIKHLVENGRIRDYGDIVVLLRSVKPNHLENYEKAFDNMKIPYVSLGKAGLFTTSLGMSFLHFFDFLASNNDEVDDSFLTSELLCLKDPTISTIQRNLNRINKEILPKISIRRDADIIKGLIDLKHSSSNKGILETVYALLKITQYIDTLSYREDYDNIAILSKITNVAAEYEENYFNPTLLGFSNYIRELWECNLIDIPEENLLRTKKVKIMTVHQAKGLEFPVVVVGESLKGRFPAVNRKAPYYEPIECAKRPLLREPFEDEERRLYYVAMTRARDLLIINSANRVSDDSTRGPGETPWLSHIAPAHFSNVSDIASSIITLLGIDYVIKEELNIFSYSKLKYYEFCPYRYFMVFEMGLYFPMKNYFVIGANAHRALKYIHDKVIDGKMIDETDVPGIVELTWDNIRGSKRENDLMKEHTVKEISTYVRNNKSAFPNILWAEKEFWVYYNTGIFTGRVDLIRGLLGGYEIIDFKTGEIDVIDSEEQLYVYTYGCAKAYKLSIGKMSLYNLERDSTHPEGEYTFFMPVKSKIEDVELKIQGILQKINEKKFEPLPDRDKCKKCELYEFDICPYSKK